VTVTDPALRSKTYTLDSFGSLTQVDEPNPQGGTYTTTYTYTVRNQLATVSMTRSTVTQTRQFKYDTPTGLLTILRFSVRAFQ
jgi:hypothetical protein